VVDDLMDAHPGQFVVVEYHTQYDGFDTPWGIDRLNSFYGGWCGTLIPVML
jgi:hypothetical protein